VKDVLRRLWALSGNECAFPDCTARLIDADGVLISEIVHIRGALRGSARFDPSQTNEERRSFENLLLMCHRHHKGTDNEKRFTTERMTRIKRAHENRYAQVIESLQRSVSDLTIQQVPTHSTTLGGLFTSSGLTAEEIAGMKPDFVRLADRLATIPPDARAVFSILVMRGDDADIDGAVSIRASIVQDVAGVLPRRLSEVCELLDRADLATLDHGDDFEPAAVYSKRAPAGIDWPILKDLQSFVRKDPGSADLLFVGLDFSVLD
jgi:hypothetical protein